MRETELRLVDQQPQPVQRPKLGWLLPLIALIAAAWGSYRGADDWLHPLDARDHVRNTVELALERGGAAPEVREALRELRRELGERPLDSARRVQYAALLLSLTREMQDTQAAVRHAKSAAALAPVTLPVVRLAALILARSGDTGGALNLTRSVFAFDVEGASELMLLLEEAVPTSELHRALPDRPDAWAGWASRLTQERRDDEAQEWLERAGERWPQNLEIRVAQARRAVQSSRWERLGALVSEPLAEDWRQSTEGESWAGLRALWLARSGRDAEARTLLNDLEREARMNPPLLTSIGDAHLALGDPDSSRRAWSEALFRTSSNALSTRVTLHVRLATLEQERGEASAALRHWRAILKLDPEHPLAQRQVEKLTGRSGYLMLTSASARRFG